MLSRIKRVERSNQIRLPGQFKVKAVHQFRVIARLNAHRESALKAGDTRHCPSVQSLPFQTLVLGNRKLPKVTDDDPVPGIKQRERAIAATADRLQDVLKAGSVVDGLAESVRHFELEAVTQSPFQRCLQGVVVRRCFRILGKDAGKYGDT